MINRRFIFRFRMCIIIYTFIVQNQHNALCKVNRWYGRTQDIHFRAEKANRESDHSGCVRWLHEHMMLSNSHHDVQNKLCKDKIRLQTGTKREMGPIIGVASPSIA
jgi:hypothetical protein